MDNNRKMKLYSPVCMKNNRQMKLYYPVCMEKKPNEALCSWMFGK